MANKEERIYICSKEKVCQICKDNCAEFDGIVPCGNCGYKDFPSMTRQEAIEVMAKAFWPWDFFPSEIDEGKGWNDLNNWQKDKYRGQAKQALNALLEGVKK